MDTLWSLFAVYWGDLVVYVKALLSLGALGLLWEGFNWLRERRKEAREAAEAAEQARIDAYNDGYRSINDKYFSLLTTLLQYPELGVMPWMDTPDKMSSADRARRMLFYDMLTSIFENAWVNRARTTEIADFQWPGWERFIIAMLRWPSYREYIETDPTSEEFGGYDRRFENYLDELMAKYQVVPVKTAPEIR
ncbi:hypothetical protein [Rhizobium grahamii]|uniref:DUF4760 domain-containing protein n=1 Tax=Rhizobium grahamii CCGE 502 TaxID=990285 RepID=S3HKT8_9HYPH|nr:hypothetical protein [Rhizobium grahamii]EPE98645.1 hypothetical protein RGCCGE502_09470 [Rhizobium grahamii CCGE 502]